MGAAHTKLSFRFTRRSAGLLCLVAACVLVCDACSTAPPDGITPVTPFDAQRYTGTWYEIARLENRFEKNLNNVSAHYRLQPDGSVQVTNRGYNSGHQQWEQVVGRAQFIGDPQHASLKVSFFGPFYGGYHVVALDPDYRWSLVVGAERGYMWILARDKQLPADVKTRLLDQARALQIPLDTLVWVAHDREDSAPLPIQ